LQTTIEATSSGLNHGILTGVRERVDMIMLIFKPEIEKGRERRGDGEVKKET
jgi:hypothetical protein